MRKKSNPGFTLIELVIAMSLFALLSTALVSLLSRATSLLAEGNSGVDTMDALQLASETFEKDVSTIYTMRDADEGRPNVRLYADFVECKFDGDNGRLSAGIQRLAFVRLIPNEATSPLTRNAGTSVGANATAYIDQKDDAAEAAEGKLRATGGMMEVFYAAVPTPMSESGDSAVMKLYRGIRSPIGGPGSLLPTKRAGDPSATVEERGPVDGKEIRAIAEPLLSGVLFFGVEFWSRKTVTWDPALKPPRGPSLTWDSSRGILAPGQRGRETFFMAKSGSGKDGSLDYPVDDTFPRKLRIVLVVEELGRNARVGLLAEDVAPDAKSLSLLSTDFVPASEGTRRFVKIGTEWIQFETVSGSTLTGCKRGMRGTTPQAHRADARVHHGRTLHREFPIATFRDSYQEDIITRVR